MQMDEGLDTGDIRRQRALPIAPDETGESLLGKLGPLGASALEEALPVFSRGELPRTPQDHSKATLAPMLRREDGEADFSRTALDLDRRRRGFTPWPGLWTKASGVVLKIHASEPLPSGGRAPGEIVGASAAGIDVSCGEGTLLRLREVQPEGKKRMPASAYLAGHPLRPGDTLGS
jgi:methionyl-tRNA formyltransferase